jgi:tryptophan-rich sensory protein
MVAPPNRDAGLLLSPRSPSRGNVAVAAWIAFATALVIGIVQLNGWATPHG